MKRISEEVRFRPRATILNFFMIFTTVMKSKKALCFQRLRAFLLSIAIRSNNPKPTLFAVNMQ